MAGEKTEKSINQILPAPFPFHPFQITVTGRY
jgi:hypothetical protein